MPEIQQFWKQMMDQFGSEKKYLEQTIDDFEKKPTPEIIICVDKLLTGFDAPCNTVLYIDKRLRDHSILQAIARVNRLFDGKDFGLVVDYRGPPGFIMQLPDHPSGVTGHELELGWTPWPCPGC
jgi:type I restriction enzyme R subunit